MGEVDPRLVVISADLAQPHLAGVLEAADVGALRLAVFVVGVDADESAGAVGLRNNRAALVARQELARGRAGAVILEDRLVDPRPEDVAMLERVAGVIIGDGIEAIVRESRRGGAGDLVQPHPRIVAEGDPARCRGHQILG